MHVPMLLLTPISCMSLGAFVRASVRAREHAGNERVRVPGFVCVRASVCEVNARVCVRPRACACVRVTVHACLC